MAEVFELFPAVCGVILALLLTRVRSPFGRGAIWLIGSACAGALATVLSGEWRFGWEYLLFDIPVVAAAAAVSYAACRGWMFARKSSIANRKA